MIASQKELPTGWKWVKLGEVCTSTQGVQIAKRFQKSSLSNGYKRYFYISDFDDDKNIKYVEDKYPKKVFTEDDIIVSNTGTFGKVFTGKEGILSNNLFKVSYDPHLVNKGYLLTFINSPLFMDFQKRLSKGTSNPHMGHKNFASTPLPLPSLHEQKRIAEILNKSEELKKLREEANRKTEELIPAIFHEMFGNNAYVESVPLGDLVTFRSGKGLTQKQMNREGNHKVYGGNGVSGNHDEYLIEDSNIVVGRVGAYCGSVHLTEPKSWVTDNALYMTEKKKEFKNIFLLWCLKLSNLNRLANKTAQPVIAARTLHKQVIKLPDINLQLLFADRIEKANEVKIPQDRVSNDLYRFQSSLLHKAFRGEL